MKISSAGKPISRTAARNCFLINQFATPGLGSLMGRRLLPGIGQLSLALLGFSFLMAWFVAVMIQTYNQLTQDIPPHPAGWLGQLGGACFAAAWCWSLITSLSLLRQARRHEAETSPPATSNS